MQREKYHAINTAFFEVFGLEKLKMERKFVKINCFKII